MDDLGARSVEDGHGVRVEIVEGGCGELVGQASAEVPERLWNSCGDELDDEEETSRLAKDEELLQEGVALVAEDLVVDGLLEDEERYCVEVGNRDEAVPAEQT